MARRRASMREGPRAGLCKATEAAQRQAQPAPPADEPHESTVEHVPTWEDEVETPAPPTPQPGPAEPGPVEPTPQPKPPAPDPTPEPTPPPPIAPEPPVTRYVEPTLPEPAPRLHRAPSG